MGKASTSKVSNKGRSAEYVDPAIDKLAVLDARNMLLSNMLSMGWRLAVMVLLPIFIGVQIDKKFDSSPSATLAAFFIAIFGAGMLIYKTYTDMSRQQQLDAAKDTKSKPKNTDGGLDV